MSKVIINVEMVKKMVSENGGLLSNYSAFCESELSRAVRKGNVEPEALAYIYNNAPRSWEIRKQILTKCGFTRKEYAKYKMFDRISYNGDWSEYHSKVTDYYDSGADFCSHVYEIFGVNLIGDEVITKSQSNREFSSFCSSLFINPVHSGMTDEQVEKFKKVYIEMLPYLFKIRGYLQNSNKAERKLATLVENATIISFETIKGLIEKYNISRAYRVKVYVEIANRFFRSRTNRVNFLESADELIYKVLPAVKEFYPEGLIPGDVKHSYEYENFMESLLSNCGACFNNTMSFTRKQKDALFKLLIENTVDNCPYRGYPLRNYYIAATLNLAPVGEVDGLFDKLGESYGYDRVIEVTTDIVGQKKSDIKITEYITNKMIAKGIGWDNLIIPEEKFYDVEYLKEVCNKIQKAGGRGRSGVLFGRRWDENYHTINKIDIDKVPKEFFEEFGSHISWSAISKCKNMSLEFMKVNIDEIEFSAVCGSVASKIDEELAIALIKKYKGMENVRGMLAYSKSLSASFVAKNIKYLNRFEGSRKIVTSGGNHKLSDILAAI